VVGVKPELGPGAPSMNARPTLTVHARGEAVNPLAGDELLPAVDVVRRAREGGVAHDVYGKRSDVGRFDNAPDGKRGAQLIAAVFELIAQDRRRQRRVDEAGGDEVDADGCELERQVRRQRRECSGNVARIPWPTPGRRPPVPPMNTSEPPGLILLAALRAT